MSNKLAGEVKVGKVDATVAKDIAARFGISGFPTLKLFPAGKKDDSTAEPYDGARDTNSMAEWALEKKASTKPIMFEQLINQDSFDKFCKDQRGYF